MKVSMTWMPCSQRPHATTAALPGRTLTWIRLSAAPRSMMVKPSNKSSVKRTSAPSQRKSRYLCMGQLLRAVEPTVTMTRRRLMQLFSSTSGVQAAPRFQTSIPVSIHSRTGPRVVFNPRRPRGTCRCLGAQGRCGHSCHTAPTDQPRPDRCFCRPDLERGVSNRPGAHAEWIGALNASAIALRQATP